MIIYRQHYFRRKLRKMPVPSCICLAIMFAILSMCIIVVMPPIINGINVDLPKVNTQPVEIFEDFTYVTAYLRDDGVVVIDGAQSSIEETGSVIKILKKGIELDDIKIFVRADKNVSYNSIVLLLQQLSDDGFSDITLVGKYTGGVQDIK